MSHGTTYTMLYNGALTRYGGGGGLSVYISNVFKSKVIHPYTISLLTIETLLVVVVVVVVIGNTVGSISSRTLAYDCLCTLEFCTASMIATS